MVTSDAHFWKNSNAF